MDAVEYNLRAAERQKDKIEAILKEKGMTKGDLAQKMGVSPQSLSRSLKCCSPKTLSKIAQVLEIDEQDLIGVPVIKVEAQVPETSEPQSENLNGYVECKGKVFKITSKEDLYKVIAYCDGYTLNKEEEDGE